MRTMKALFILVLSAVMLSVAACGLLPKAKPEYEVRVNQDVFTLFVGETCEASASAYCDGELEGSVSVRHAKVHGAEAMAEADCRFVERYSPLTKRLMTIQ